VKGGEKLTCPVDFAAWGGERLVRMPEERGGVGEIAVDEGLVTVVDGWMQNKEQLKS